MQRKRTRELTLPLHSGAPMRSRKMAFLLAIVCVWACLMTSVIATGARADDASDAEQEAAQAAADQAALRSSLEGVDTQLGQAYLDLEAAKTALSTAQSELNIALDNQAAAEREKQLATDKLAVAQADQEALNTQAEENKERVEDNTKAVAGLVVSAYQGDSNLTTFSYVLESEDVEDLSQRAAAMEIASGVQESVLTQAEADRAVTENRKSQQDAVTKRIDEAKQEADVAAQAAADAADTAQAKRDDVAAKEQAQADATAALESQKSSLQSQIDQRAKDEADALARAQEIYAANQALLAAGQISSVSSSSIPADELGSGYIGHPIAGPLYVTSPFGYRIHPVTGIAQGHQGVDFAASCGTPQVASVSGVATYWNSPSCGNGIDIDGGIIDGHSYVITLCHLQSRSIANGQYVNRGDVVGYTGSTGYATGCHVHFQVARDGAYIDGMTLPGF
ncbi:peptidoglycan DD-metalloendopeptidase family protein [Actinomyces vulturis]|uniref:peptidoglycan DD-metalloendopeptidase family protein n=1 Tax=Actinomyces vulturis TaxID=1857645 RepID=UPI000A3FF1DC|nr:peptidoglycan DD-metalloendopeptidase family protein [Actinomyces vulturis]